MDATRDLSDVTHRKRGLRFEKSQLVEFLPRKKKVDFRLLAEALRQVSHMVWGRSKSQHRKMVSLSLWRKTFKLKGIKKFRTWTKKSWVFFVFRDSYVIYICVMDIMNVLRTGMNMYILRIHIWLCNTLYSWYIPYNAEC